MASRKLVERVTARVFCHGPGGGNPVTVFSSEHPLSVSTQARLAKDCEWESVMVSNTKKNANNKLPEMAFFMPSGEEVSFCAHAALGGASVVTSSRSDFAFETQMTREHQMIKFMTSEDNNEKGADSIEACLYMKAKFEESRVSHPPSLQRLLRSHLGITSQELIPSGRQGRLPNFVNCSIARPKTLVCVNTLDALAQARTPKSTAALSDASPPEEQRKQQRNSFETACRSIDDSTGIYLYAEKEEGGWECRQFPRSSGYPEDPATGIAAAALAASLYHQAVYLSVYKFYQGTAMGRPSLIQVHGLQMDGDKIRFGLQGRVEMDNRDTIELLEEE